MNHLNEERIAAAMIEHDAETALHLRDCAECAAKLETLRAALNDFGSFVHENTERANTFWWRQRAATPHRSAPFTRWATAAAAVAIVIGASTTLVNKVGKQKPAVSVENPQPLKRTISDEALLSEVQNDVQREYADAFAPVQTNAESAVAFQAQSARSKKVHKGK